MIQKIFGGTVKNGELQITGSHSFSQYLKTLPRVVDVIVRPRCATAQHTISQRKYYFIMVTAVAESTGSSKGEVHKDVKEEYLPNRAFYVCDKCGKHPEINPSIKLLTESEMDEYLKKVKLWAESQCEGLIMPDRKDPRWNI